MTSEKDHPRQDAFEKTKKEETFEAKQGPSASSSTDEEGAKGEKSEKDIGEKADGFDASSLHRMTEQAGAWLGSLRGFLGKWLLPADPTSQIKDLIKDLHQDIAAPCLMLLGEPQVGKSSIVRTLARDASVRIGQGDGIPVTEGITAYRFPQGSEIPLWHFLDTPGLGNQERPLEQARLADLFSGRLVDRQGAKVPRPQMILACLRCDDRALGLLPWLQEVASILARERTSLPVLVAQTSLHRILHPHPMPYPFGSAGCDLPADLPNEVRATLIFQRSSIQAVFPKASFVVLDLTDPQDEVGQPDYGADALLEAIIRLLPETLAAMLQASRSSFDALHSDHASALILSYSTMAAAAGALPPPLGDIATLAIALTLLRNLATLYRQPIEMRTILDLLWSLGSTTLLWLVIRYLIRRIPIPVLMAPVGAAGAFSLVFSLGHLMAWFYRSVRDGSQPKPTEIREYWSQIQSDLQKQLLSFFPSFGGGKDVPIKEAAVSEEAAQTEASPMGTETRHT